MHTGRSHALSQPPSPPRQPPSATVASDCEQPAGSGGCITFQNQEGRLLPAATRPDAVTPGGDRKVTPSTSAVIYVNSGQDTFGHSSPGGQGENVHSSAGAYAFQAFLQQHGNDGMPSEVEGSFALTSDADSTQVLSAEEFKEMLLSGKVFSSGVCYIVKGDIDLSGDTRLKTLPDHLIVLGELNLEDCYALRNFPKNLYVQKDCIIISCFNLKALGERLIVMNDFDASGCTEITDQTGSMSVHGNINMTGCGSLKTWTGKTQCKGSFYLTRCVRLACLKHIEVENDVDLSGCYQLRILPESERDFKVGGNIVLSGCKRLSPLPEYIISQGDSGNSRIRYITIDNWDSIPRCPDERDRAFNENIKLACQPLDNAPDETFDDFTKAFGFWSRNAQSGQLAPGIEHLNDSDKGTLVEYMEHLTRTAEYRVSPGSLAQRVLNVLPLISEDSDGEIRARALDTMYSAIITCGDKVILALNDLECLTLLVLSERRLEGCNDPDEAKSTARQMLYLRKIKEHARKFANEKDLDDVEVELTLHLAFQKEFNLPGQTVEIESGYDYELDERRKKEIQETIKNECTEKEVEEYLKNWPFWQQFERSQDIPAFDQLPVAYVTSIREYCDLTNEEVSETTQMVLLPEPEDIQLTYEALCETYKRYGTNPYTRQPLDWNKVRRIHSRPGVV
ncbi:NEL-type E3 ubiquitin ligase domain-containing protein [Endozoicomonas lisbonensis]|uniref:RING-type E3 ubiquitin transferase n=1 Tax=Endozoicomonas lisbonensis TaxID=3120522 RepID=A0ABV2SHM0_9GAMM